METITSTEVNINTNVKINWVIGVCCTDGDGVEIYRVYGTKKQVMEYIRDMMRKERKEDSWKYDYCIKVAENKCSWTQGYIYGCNVFHDYHTDYSAYPETDPIVLGDEKEIVRELSR